MTSRLSAQQAQAVLDEPSRIVESAQDGIIGVDIGGTITYWNRGAEILYGYSAGEIVGKNAEILFPPEQKGGVADILQRIRSGEELARHQAERIDKAGRRLHLSLTHSPVRDVAGHIIGMSVIVHDVSALKRAQEELHTAAHYTRSLLEASLDPLVTISPGGKITDVNEAAVQATGIARDKLVGTDFADCFTDPDAARSGYREIFAKGFIRDYPLSIRHRSGATMDVLYNASLYRDLEGRVDGAFAAARDVTALKRAENELRQSLKHTRSLIEASLDPLVTISTVGKITDVNRATEEATGLPREKLIGTDFASYFTQPEAAEAGYLQVLHDGTVRDYPLVLRHTSGSRQDVLYNAAVYYDEAGVPQGVFAAARDITARKRAEEELQKHRLHLEEMVESRTAELKSANERLEFASKEIESFAYSVSHDLRAPLRAIDGFSHILLEEHAAKLDAEALRLLDVVRDSAKKMNRLIDGILEFSRAGRTELRPQSVDMAALAEAVIEDLRAGGAGKIQFKVGALPRAQCDEEMLRRVWTNLLDNAVKFSAPKPDALIEIGATAGEGETVYFVRDNGVGFDMTFVDKVFGTFQRLHGAEFPGTGIGLAIVKRIVARHGGRVWAEGRPGEGATFYFSLPTREDRDA